MFINKGSLKEISTSLVITRKINWVFATSSTWTLKKFHSPVSDIINCSCVVLSSTDFEKSIEMGASVRPKCTTTLPRTGTGEMPSRAVPTRKVIGGSPSAIHLEGHRSTSCQKPKLVRRAFRC